MKTDKRLSYNVIGKHWLSTSVIIDLSGFSFKLTLVL